MSEKERSINQIWKAQVRSHHEIHSTCLEPFFGMKSRNHKYSSMTILNRNKRNWCLLSELAFVFYPPSFS